MGHINPSGLVMIYLYTKVTIFENLMKNLIAAGVLRKIFALLYLSLKLSLTLPHKRKVLWCSYFKSFIKSKIFSRCGNFVDKWNFVSTPGEIIILLGNSCYQLFSPNSQKLSLWCKKSHYPPRWICMTYIWSPTLFPGVIIIFQGVQTKFHFLMKFPHLEKFVNLMKNLKYEHQGTFPLWGRVKLNFRDRYRKPNIYSKNSSHYQVFSSNSQNVMRKDPFSRHAAMWLFHSCI